ncbi:MAG: TRAP transporter large permease subunit [Thermus sp.]|uniref:TRAP transporter large permease n=1 Tax=unclassified Thermus TaxID=2619321 RepID=UPI0002389575|nr:MULTISPECIES: TRAP transporter large permease subunit [unclassified Thermus]AEV15163.1 TRAP dicarboxylate transporter, DctM subunit [Thermus sp. CCB_US3_UF1]MCS6867774.1 TRAP transporter large permease subunit [Thermus sp.]MCS7219234.1 TRAP transporter large permease subunit [Thermus sp.]MCX7850471.1 TRAP transporter large permease subunit [Thermus sp.]MDW8018005.1 TRAP transporter large permease subunit [Thermus sp.]
MLLSFAVFLLLLLLGMPVVFAIGIGGLVFFLTQPGLQLTMPVQLALAETQNFSLLAIPTFILASNLMNELGVTRRLLQFAYVLTGFLRGGLAQVSVLMGFLMGGVSGSAIADATMQARLLGPEMVRKGYPRGFIAALQGFSGLLAVAIPPSIGLILYGSIGQVSIGQLFAGGIGVGVLMALSYMLTVAFLARRQGYAPEASAPPKAREVWQALRQSFWAVLFPFLLLASLRFGVFVPSEVGAAAVVYALFVGLVYRELSLERLGRALSHSVRDVGMVALLISMAAVLGYGMKWEMVPQQVSGFLLEAIQNPQVALLLILITLLLLGTVLDSTVMIILLTPILVPAAKALGIDLVYFGVLMVLTCAVGLLTPPVGLSMYSVCSVMGCGIGEYVREGWPLFLATLWVLLLAYLFPGVVLFLPRLLF